MAKRFRPNMIHIYLHPDEDNFVKKYAEDNYVTVSELIRGWIHEVMKIEGYEIKEPKNPEIKEENKHGRIQKKKDQLKGQES